VSSNSRPLYCLSFLDLRLLITPLISCNSRSLCKCKKDKQCNGLELEDTKGVIRSRKSKDRQYNGLELEDTKGVIRSRNSKDRQYNDLDALSVLLRFTASDDPFGIF
jgi:hypothetical protein